MDSTVTGYETSPHEFSYDWHQTVLYALGIGAKAEELGYLYEGQGPKVYPTFAVVPVYPIMSELIAKTKADWKQIIHHGQAVHLARPLPSAATLRTVGRIEGIYDMKRMAQLVFRTRTEADGELLFETEMSILVMGAGGFKGPRPPKSETLRVPEGAGPSFVRRDTTTREQALLYRLCGDENPLHADPSFAQEAGFEQGPILHGLCTYGYMCRAVVREACGGDASRLRGLGTQFRKPVWPGEDITVEGYALGNGRYMLQALADKRSEPVASQAWAQIAD